MAVGAKQEIKLVHYETACRAIAEANRVDEIKSIRDKASAIQEYAKQAKNTELLRHATEIRMRAERRWGELYQPEAKAKAGRPTKIGNGSKPNIPTLIDMGVTKTQSAKWQKLAALPAKEFETKIEKAKAKVENSTTSSPRHSKSEFSGEVEWYTPDEYLDLAREVLGTIDLDPASSDKAQKLVKAKNYFTTESNGLDQEWIGKVWLNPPYMQPHIANFMDKMIAELTMGNVSEAIMLTHNYTDTEWFHVGAKQCAAICFTRGRIKFYSSDGEIAAPTQGQALFYFGGKAATFKKVFGKVGFVLLPASRAPRDD
jgi:phage N-6-adenine-methyltransferase